MNFGKEVEVTCPSCGTKSLAVIPDYGKLGDLLQKLGSIINETLSENGEVIDTINTIIEEGFHIELAIFGRVNPIFQDKPAKPVQSKVRDGEIKLGTFSSKDTE